MFNCMTVQPVMGAERTVFYRERSSAYYAPGPYAVVRLAAWFSCAGMSVFRAASNTRSPVLHQCRPLGLSKSPTWLCSRSSWSAFPIGKLCCARLVTAPRRVHSMLQHARLSCRLVGFQAVAWKVGSILGGGGPRGLHRVLMLDDCHRTRPGMRRRAQQLTAISPSRLLRSSSTSSSSISSA